MSFVYNTLLLVISQINIMEKYQRPPEFVNDDLLFQRALLKNPNLTRETFDAGRKKFMTSKISEDKRYTTIGGAVVEVDEEDFKTQKRESLGKN